MRLLSIAAFHSLGGLRLIVQPFTLITQELQAAYNLRLHFTLAASQSRRITPLSAPSRLRAPLDRLCARAHGSNAQDEETSCEAGSEEAIRSIGDIRAAPLTNFQRLIPPSRRSTQGSRAACDFEAACHTCGLLLSRRATPLAAYD